MNQIATYPQALDSLANDTAMQGRFGMLLVTNLGRMQGINKANGEVLNDNQETSTRIERVTFGGNHKYVSWLLNMHLSTVGNNMSIIFSSHAPLISSSRLERIADQFSTLIVENRV